MGVSKIREIRFAKETCFEGRNRSKNNFDKKMKVQCNHAFNEKSLQGLKK